MNHHIQKWAKFNQSDFNFRTLGPVSQGTGFPYFSYVGCNYWQLDTRGYFRL